MQKKPLQVFSIDARRAFVVLALTLCLAAAPAAGALPWGGGAPGIEAPVFLRLLDAAYGALLAAVTGAPHKEGTHIDPDGAPARLLSSAPHKYGSHIDPDGAPARLLSSAPHREGTNIDPDGAPARLLSSAPHKAGSHIDPDGAPAVQPVGSYIGANGDPGFQEEGASIAPLG